MCLILAHTATGIKQEPFLFVFFSVMTQVPYRLTLLLRVYPDRKHCNNSFFLMIMQLCFKQLLKLHQKIPMRPKPTTTGALCLCTCFRTCLFYILLTHTTYHITHKALQPLQSPQSSCAPKNRYSWVQLSFIAWITSFKPKGCPALSHTPFSWPCCPVLSLSVWASGTGSALPQNECAL